MTANNQKKLRRANQSVFQEAGDLETIREESSSGLSEDVELLKMEAIEEIL